MQRDYLARGFLGGLLLLIFVLPHYSSAQITFERTYGGDNRDQGRSVHQTSDGGYIIAGYTKSFGAGSTDVYLIKTDSLGDTLWTRAYGGTDGEYGHSVQQTSDGGYIIAGETQSLGSGLSDVYLIKTDSLGYLLWEKAYGWAGSDEGNSVQQTIDGGYIIGGTAWISGSGVNVYLLKTNPLGNAVWEESYGGPGLQHGYSVQQTSDSGYIVAGHTGGFGRPGVYLIKTGSFGNVLWERTFGDSAEDVGWFVQQTSDGGYVIFGGTSSFGAGSRDFYLVKTDSLGNSLWEKTYGGAAWDRSFCGGQTLDGGYILTGTTWSFGAGEVDAYLVKTDSLGNKLWQRTYGGIGHDAAISVQQTEDGGFVIAGHTEYYDPGLGNVYLIKTDENGLVGIGRDASVLSLEEPPDTVFADSIYRVKATVKNFGNVLDIFRVVATIDGYCDTSLVEDLGPGLSREVQFGNWQVPPSDSTTYAMNVCVYTVNDVDSTNDCMQKTIFAYNPTGIADENRNSKIENRPVFQNTPNPFHKTTVISYSLANPAYVTLTVFDITGSLVATLVDEHREPGVCQVRWNASDNPSGVYFITLQTASQSITNKMILLR